MVRSDVEHRRPGAAQLLDAFQLIAGELADGRVERAVIEHAVAQRVPQVAAGEDARGV